MKVSTISTLCYKISLSNLYGSLCIEADYIVNAAGLFCEDIANMVGKYDYTVVPRKGQFYIFGKNTGYKVNHIVLPIPIKVIRGKLMTPTIHDNMLVGLDIIASGEVK